MKKHQPKLNLPTTKNEKILNSISLFGIVLIFGVVLLNYGDLPERIPIHFGFSGEPDRYGHKSFLWGVPIISALTFMLLEGVRRIPHTFNYPIKITEQNAKVQYSLARTMMASVNLVTVILFLTLTWNIIQVATGQSSRLGMILVVLVLALLMAPLLIYSRMAKKIG